MSRETDTERCRELREAEARRREDRARLDRQADHHPRGGAR
ncbi:hypothetical protein [Streptomyces sp. SM12]|nr:hypothetical protein [Streptomyces sp. SM12]